MKRGDRRGQKSFAGRVTRPLLVILLVTFVASMFVTNRFIRENLVENAIENGSRNVEADGTALGTYLSSLQRSAMEIYYNTSIYTILYESEHDYTECMSVFSFLQSMINLSEGGEVAQIYLNLYRSGESYLVGSTGRAMGDGSWEVPIPEDLEQYQASCEGPHEGHTYGLDLDAQTEGQVCSFHWQIYSTMGNAVIGTLSMDIFVDKLAGYLSSVENDNPVYLLNTDGTQIFANTELLDEEMIQQLFLQGESTGWVELETESFRGIAFLGTVKSDLAGWRIVELKTEKQLFEASNRILIWELLFMLCAGLLCAGLTVWMIHRTTRPLRDLREYVQVVEKGNLKADIRDYTAYQREDEIGELILHMDHMIHTVNDMFIREQNLSRAHRDVEMRMLLAQINPHFIYNTLQSISTLALVHQDTEVYRLLVKLGAQMQYSMNLEQEVVELGQEIRYTENYLDLQRQRFGERFRYEIVVVPGAERVTVPRMMLQPLAENAIKHGQIHRIQNGFLRIRVEREGEELILCLEDNGRGCPEERQQEIREKLRQTAEESAPQAREHIGMQNVAYRLKLMYGEKASVTIETSQWNGAWVRVVIPLDQYEGGPKHEGIDCG